MLNRSIIDISLSRPSYDGPDELSDSKMLCRIKEDDTAGIQREMKAENNLLSFLLLIKSEKYSCLDQYDKCHIF